MSSEQAVYPRSLALSVSTFYRGLKQHLRSELKRPLLHMTCSSFAVMKSGAVIEGRGSGWKGRTLYTEVRAVRGERELMR